MKLEIDQFLGLAGVLEAKSGEIKFAGDEVIDGFQDLSLLDKIHLDNANPAIDEVAESLVKRFSETSEALTPDEIECMAVGLKIGLVIGKYIELTKVPGIPAATNHPTITSR